MLKSRTRQQRGDGSPLLCPLFRPPAPLFSYSKRKPPSQHPSFHYFPAAPLKSLPPPINLQF